jgi:hypothetical protein
MRLLGVGSIMFALTLTHALSSTASNTHEAIFRFNTFGDEQLL